MALTKVRGAGAEGLTLSTTDLKIDSGDLVFSTADKGVVLGATSNTDANTLDDYEEGTWTPTLSSTSATFSYSYNSGTYVKAGNMVSCWGRITLSGTPGGTTGNALFIAGLPFTIYNQADQYAGDSLGHFIHLNVPSSYSSAALQYQQNSTTVIVVNTGDNVGESAAAASALNSSSQFRFRLTYRSA